MDVERQSHGAISRESLCAALDCGHAEERHAWIRNFSGTRPGRCKDCKCSGYQRAARSEDDVQADVNVVLETLLKGHDLADLVIDFALDAVKRLRRDGVELARCQVRLLRTNEDRAQWRERAIAAEQALGLYGRADT